ncbi:hypothetical protein BDFB_008704 [Asbolus verrucosus]|uniref:Uncharacterized protein n=1 Tax=Asbolus verrucosus TaxID=1661398 RepID=A0A482W9I2_ASBVE|nr:hypothetical protein BDFB_008704 [Asbolus verrucosus]
MVSLLARDVRGFSEDHRVQ